MTPLLCRLCCGVVSRLEQAQPDEHTEDATILSDEARQTLAWIEALDGP